MPPNFPVVPNNLETPDTIDLTTPDLQRLVLLEQRNMFKRQFELFEQQSQLIAVQLELAQMQKAKLIAETTHIKTEK